MTSQLKAIAKSWCPPLLWSAARSCAALLSRDERDRAMQIAEPLPPPRESSCKTLTTLQEVDHYLNAARDALAISNDASFKILDSFHFAPPTDLPSDPTSAEYRHAQMEFHKFLSGREYSPTQCEQMALDDDKRKRPFPYYTRSSTIIGEQLAAIGFLIRALDLPPGGSVLEFGAGFGRLTMELIRSDFRVTAVEINPLYADLIREQALAEGLNVSVDCTGMLDFQSTKRFDRVIFYESFHHCDDHMQMIARLDELVAPGGAVVFAGEPICDDFPMPWGLRRDGRSLWAIRHFGWLELGFRTDYFLELLSNHGWSTTLLASADVPWQRVFIARRAMEQRSR